MEDNILEIKKENIKLLQENLQLKAQIEEARKYIDELRPIQIINDFHLDKLKQILDSKGE